MAETSIARSPIIVSLPVANIRIDDMALQQDAVAGVRDAFARLRGNAWLCVAGARSSGRRSLLVSAAAERGLDVIEINCAAIAGLPRDAVVPMLRAIARECRVLLRVPLLRDIDQLDALTKQLVGSELARHLDTVVLATSRSAQPNVSWADRAAVIVEVGRATTPQLESVWSRHLGPEGADFAARFRMAPGLVVRAIEAAKMRVEDGVSCSASDVLAGVRSVLDDSMSAYAKRVKVTQGWEDLVLTDEQHASIVELVARIRRRTVVLDSWGFADKVGNKGLGVSALFHGVPGSGKSMVCGLIAKELGLDLYVVDMSRITSKWIGETEKALAELFDAAEASYAALLIDEADSLLGKRTDQKSSNDRYANQTTNFLLYRLEAYEGIVFMTTNHEANIDPAFARRMTLRLRFDLPDRINASNCGAP